MGLPILAIDGDYFTENPMNKWMIYGYPYFRKPPYGWKCLFLHGLSWFEVTRICPTWKTKNPSFGSLRLRLLLSTAKVINILTTTR